MTPYYGSSQTRNYKLYDFVAHGSAVTCLALGQKSGQVMVTGGDDAKVNLWAVGKPNCIMSLHGHKTSVECAKFNCSEDIVGAGSASGAIKLWDLEAAKIIQTLTGHRTNVRCLDFHPYGQFLASGSFDTSIKLWDYRKKGCIYTYKIHSNEVHCLRLSPDGRWLASGGNEGSVMLYDIVASKLLAELKGHSAAITDLVFHPNEFFLSSSSLDGTVKFWDLESFAQVSSSAASGYLGPVRKVAFHPDGRALLAAGKDTLKVFGWEPTVVYDSVDVHWGRLSDMAVLDEQLVAGSCSKTNASVYLVNIASLRPFAEDKRQKDAAFDVQLLGDSGITFPRNPLRQSTRRSFNFDQSSKTCKHLESLESNKSNGSSGLLDDQLETSTVSSDGDDGGSVAAEIFNACDYKEIFHSRREYPNSPAPTEAALVGSLPPSYSVASFATITSSSSSSSSSSTSSSGKSLNGIAPITSRGRHPTLNSSMRHGISESLTNLSNHQQQNIAASYKNNNLNGSSLLLSTSAAGGNLNLNLNNNNNNSNSNHLSSSGHGLNQQLSHASSLSRLNHIKVEGDHSNHQLSQTAHQHFPALLSPIKSPNQNYPVLTPIQPLSSTLSITSNNNNHHHQTRNHNLPNKITSVVRPVVNDASGGGTGGHRPPISQAVQPQQKAGENNHRINRDRSTSTSNVSTVAEHQQQPGSQFIIPDTRDGHCAGLLDYNDFLPKHIVQYGYGAQPPVTELEAVADIAKGHKAAKAGLDYRRRQVAIVLAMWATKDARTALEYAVNLGEKSVVIDILNVMVLKASTWNLDICLIMLPCIQELLESKYESYMSVGCTALSLILKTFSSIIKNNIAAPPGIGVDISREERYNKCIKCYNQLLSARAFVLKRQTLQGKIGRSFRELSILMQNLD